MPTEKQKMLEGRMYNANYDPLLLNERLRCAGLTHRLNLLPPSQTEEREDLLRRLLGRAPGHFTIVSPFYCDYGYNISLGENFFANMNLTILDEAPVSIGNNVFIGPGCGIYTALHPLDRERRNKGLEYARAVTIGNDVWMGGGVSILPGVTIGDGTVIGAGSVVTHSMPAGVLAAGNPCRVLRPITEKDAAFVP